MIFYGGWVVGVPENVFGPRYLDIVFHSRCNPVFSTALFIIEIRISF